MNEDDQYEMYLDMVEEQNHPVTGSTTSKEAEEILFNATMTQQVKDEKNREFLQEYEGAK